MEMHHGHDHMPSREELDEMVEDIYRDSRPDLKGIMDDEEDEDDMRQRYGRRRLLRDLLGVLLVRELIGRRPRHGYGYNNWPYYGGY
jgi:hypothetical protein